VSADDKAAAAWDDYVSQQQEEKIEQLERELNAANDRIKRLEEAGDKLEYASVISEAGEDPNGFEKLLIAQREWRKAKEAKP
jgi:predicted RNase H-like nuclease (RuvC/YqgF family)